MHWCPSCRVSKSWNHAITQLRKIFENLRKFWTNEPKTGKTGTNFMYFSQFDQICVVSHVFMSVLLHVSAQNFQSENFNCAKEFTFRKSALGLP